ncbi:hypothetical protein Mal64_25070 [Pseudobythopirellula maris]|uniref:Uncharacterized protein n=1 Tax=Pseudobythopirellula maris TaxID=2527991 RepID=A0A5C5ZPB8_9BACT|nr:hypothetical protein [Pseudobythopirellula maris]TWT89016.1 hypothetical protein Mal64_25070 [Pseudobythopirellula maris]
MNPTITVRRAPIGLLATLAAAWLCVAPAAAQQTNYSSAYQQMIKSRPNMDAGVDRYLYNKYYRDNPAISPYLSGAVLGGTQSGTAYTEVVRADQQRRAAAMTAQAQYVQQRKLQGNVGYTAHPGAGYMGAMPGAGLQKPNAAVGGASRSGAYQNHWYGGWAR